MKKKAKVVLSLCMSLVLCCAILAGCGKENNKTTPTPSESTSAGSITFVAADKTNWDKEIAFGEKNYTLAITLDDGGKVTLKGTEVGGSDTFEQSGTWTYEKGYGYTVTVNGYTTKTSYDKASARQIMYLVITKDNTSAGLVQFQGKDTAFRKEIAADYADYEVRDAELIFEYTSENNTNNPNSTHLYLEKDGVANSLTYQGSSPTYKRGTWVKAANGNITVSIDGTSYLALYCDTAGKEGYRIIYNSNTMFSNTTAQYTDEDFEGKVTLTLQCEEQDYTLQLTAKGVAKLYKGQEKSQTGSYTKNGDVLTVDIAGLTFTSDKGLIEINFTIEKDSCNKEEVDRIFATDGSVPVGTAKPSTGDNNGQQGGDNGGSENNGGDNGGSENNGGDNNGQQGGDNGGSDNGGSDNNGGQ